jgi:preprotein translocase subunit Sec61beta
MRYAYKPLDVCDFMKRDKMQQTPSGMAGLVRYDGGDKSIIKLTPKNVIALCTGFIILEILMMVLL